MVQSFANWYDIGNQVRFASQCWALALITTICVAGAGVVFVFAVHTGVKSLIVLKHGFLPVVNVFFSSLPSRVEKPHVQLLLGGSPHVV